MADPTTEDAWLSSILEMPEDDLRRLVFADWLEERNRGDDADRAEFIRVQIRIAEYERQPIPKGVRKLADTVSAFFPPERVYSAVEPADVKKCREREYQLFERYKCRWFGGDSWAIYYLGHEREDADAHLRGAIVTRGFVGEVACNLTEWFGSYCEGCSGVGDDGGRLDTHTICPTCSGTGQKRPIGPAAVAVHPIQRVTITDLQPWTEATNSVELDGYGWCWWRESAWAGSEASSNRIGNLPDDVFDLMAELYPDNRMIWGGPPRFPTPEAANDALSRTLIKWAKRRAKADTHSAGPDTH
jgi:uncharacterized protein (TIGR02996 family)